MKEIPPKITVRASSLSEELSYLKYILKNKDFYDKNGYDVAYPSNNLLQNPEIIKNEKNMLEILKNDEYDQDYYTNGKNLLISNKKKIENLILKLKEICKNWDFRIFPEYQIILTRYGPGGSYSYTDKVGIITMLITREGGFKRKNPVETVIHEITHIGIEESIVTKFDLRHWEKERLVDLIVKIVFKEELPNYNLQKSGSTELEQCIDLEAIKNLPEVIYKFKRESSVKDCDIN